MGKRHGFTQADITRAIKGVKAAGETPQRAEVLPDGRIVVHIGAAAPEPASPFDAWKAKRDAGHAKGH